MTHEPDLLRIHRGAGVLPAGRLLTSRRPTTPGPRTLMEVAHGMFEIHEGLLLVAVASTREEAESLLVRPESLRS